MTVSEKNSPERATCATRQTADWRSSADSHFGVSVQCVGESLAHAMDLKPDSHVLDVAAGGGFATLAFARRRHRVVSTDDTPQSIGKARAQWEAEGLNVSFQIETPEALTWDANRFDAVVSVFGAMFASDQETTAAELVRVVKSRGVIGMANWTPTGFMGRLFRILRRFVPPPDGTKPPVLWGDEAWLNTQFSDARRISVSLKTLQLCHTSPADFSAQALALYAPVHSALANLPEARQRGLAQAIEALVREFNTSEDGSVSIGAEYAEVVIVT